MLLLATFSLAEEAGSASPADSAPTSAPSNPSGACEALRDFRAPAVQILNAQFQPPGPFEMTGPPGAPPPPAIQLPAHCLVVGVIEKRVGVGGRPYGINFELRLPMEWNRRFLFQGGGGTNGFVAPAIGLVKGPPALTRGFAVVTQDAGHSGRDASFGEDQQARIDMIYRSYDRVTGIAKQLLDAHYGQPAARSYFMGCSEGGREALLVSQRQPLDFDGVVAGAPGFLLGVEFHSTTERMAVAAIGKVVPGQPELFSAADFQLLERHIEDQCDAADDLKDGLIDNPAACRPNWQPMRCTGRKTNDCLSGEQIDVVRAIFDGGRPTGARGLMSNGYFYDTAVATPLWRSKLNGRSGFTLAGVSSEAGLFSTPYDPGFDANSIDFVGGGADRFQEVGALNRTDGVMYSSFKLSGGKLLIYTGQADPAFSAKTLLAYYQHLAANNGGQAATADFARLFMVPGMTHCGGGKSLDDFDPLQSVVDWVEKGIAPIAMVATGKAFPGRSRPLCAWPLQSRYRGSGSTDDAANFECKTP